MWGVWPRVISLLPPSWTLIYFIFFKELGSFFFFVLSLSVIVIFFFKCVALKTIKSMVEIKDEFKEAAHIALQS